MKEFQGKPKTELGLNDDLASIGVKRGMTLLVHSSLSSIGWVVGGPPTMVRSLLNVVGSNGTLAMPAATPYCTDPSTWPGPTVPGEWLEEVRDNLPVFDPQTTPTSMGAIPETFRTWPGTLRSNHPSDSVCARGVNAPAIVREHPLAFSEGIGGPWEKLHDLGTWILLIGVGFNRCTALHFAESLSKKRRTKKHRFPIMKGGQRIWQEVQNVADDNSTLFPIVGEEFISSYSVHQGLVGDAKTMLFPMRDLVECARKFFDENL